MSGGAVDSRVTTMKFDNSEFNQKVGPTLGLLDRLKEKLNFSGSQKSMQGLQDTANRFNMSPMGVSIEGVSAKFLALSSVAIGVLSNIASRAVSTAGQILNSFSFAPIMDGFREYELKMGSIQTILSNTARHGTQLPEVNAALDELNEYADKTIYNFGAMTKNVGLFTNAGMKVEEATAVIKGFSNEAAASGTNAEGAAGAAYQLSQALSAGQIRLMDWRSLQNVGMGNKNMQNGLIEIAEAMGTLGKAGTSTKEIQDNFNGSLEKGWLSAEVMTNYLKIQGKEMDAAGMKALGLSEAQIKAFEAQSQMSEDAATKVRTFSQLMGTVKEAVGSGWAETFGIVVGDFNEATDLFTNINNVVSGFVSHSAEKRNELLQGWKDAGGRTRLLEGLGRAFKSVQEVIGELTQTFREFFPSMKVEGLVALTDGFVSFLDALRPSDETIDKMARTFAGLLAVVQIVQRVIYSLVGAIIQVAKSFDTGGTGILDFTARIGDFLVSLNAALRDSVVVGQFFNNIAGIIAIPIRLIGEFIGMLGRLFGVGGIDTSGASGVVDAIEGVNNVLEPLANLGPRIEDAFESVFHTLAGFGVKIRDALGNIGEAIGSALGPGSFDKIIGTINLGLLTAITYMIRKFTQDGVGAIGGGFLDSITETMGEVTNTLQTMQQKVKADMIQKIAIAIGILAASLWILSTIDSEDLLKALVAMAAGFIGMEMALKRLEGMDVSMLGAAKIAILTGAMTAMAASMILLATAMKIMSTIDHEDVIKTLILLGGSLKIMTSSINAIDSAGAIRSAIAIGILAVSMNALAIALKIFSTMSWGEMAHGLVAMAGALAIIIAAMHLMPKDMLLQAAALMAVGVALNAIAVAMKIFGTMDYSDTARALVAMGGALVIIAAAMRLMPLTMIAQAAGLVVVGVALNAIGAAMKIMGSMSLGDIAKGLIAMGGAIAILAIGLNAMGATAILGAAALLVAAGALAILTPILVTLGSLDVMTIVKGLLAMAGMFAVLGAAGYLLSPVTPIIMALSVAMLALGAGIALLGAGIFLLGTGVSMIVTAIVSNFTTLQTVMMTLIQTIPDVIVAFGKGFVELLVIIGNAGPQMVAAFASILESILMAIIKNAPLARVAFLSMLDNLLKVIVEASPKIFNAGLQLILGFLRALRDNIGQIVSVAADLIVNFLRTIQREQPRIVDEAAKTVIAFVNGTANAIRNNSEAMGRAGGNLATAIIEGMVRGLAGGAGAVKDAAVRAAKGALSGAMSFLGIKSPSRAFMKVGQYSSEGFALGIVAYSGKVEDSAIRVGKTALSAMKDSMARIPEAISNDLDMNPTIAPVIDLTSFRKGAAQIEGTLGGLQVRARVSLDQARSISEDRRASSVAQEEAAANEPVVLKFEQHNHSPKELSTIDIYRQTNNQLSQASRALTGS